MNKRGQKYEEKTIESELRKEKELALKSKDIQKKEPGNDNVSLLQ